MADTMDNAEELEEMEEYQVFELEDENGNITEGAVTDMFQYEDNKTYAVVNLVEGDEITGNFIIFEAIVDDESKEIELNPVDDDLERKLQALYLEELAAMDEDDE